MLSLEPTPEQEAFGSAVTALLGAKAAGVADRPLWRRLGDIGLLSIATPETGGESPDLVAGMRAAGAAGVQGPFIGAMLAARLLGGDGAAAAADGSAWVGVSQAGVGAWAEGADLQIELDEHDRPWRVECTSIEPFATLAGERWARVSTVRLEPLAADPATLAIADLGRSAWMLGAGERLLELAAAHARDRRQFGKRIGDFQAVAHSLAASEADLGAAGDLLLLAAWGLDHRHDLAGVAAARWCVQRAALNAGFVSHQVHGALGFTVERGLDRWSTGIRQLSHHPPSADGGLTLLVDSVSDRRLGRRR